MAGSSPRSGYLTSGTQYLKNALIGHKELLCLPGGKLPLRSDIMRRGDAIRNVSALTRPTREIAIELHAGRLSSYLDCRMCVSFFESMCYQCFTCVIFQSYRHI